MGYSLVQTSELPDDYELEPLNEEYIYPSKTNNLSRPFFRNQILYILLILF